MSERSLLGPVPLLQSDVQLNTERRQRSNLAQQGFLSTSGSRVESLTTAPGDITLSGQLRPPIPVNQVPIVAAELEELAAGDIGPVALSSAEFTERRKSDGYYHIEDGTVQPAHPERPEVQQYEVSLTRAGGRGSHYRAVRTRPQTVNSPITGSDPPDVPVYYTSLSAKQQLYNPDSGAVTGLDPGTAIDSDTGNLYKETPPQASNEERLVLYDTSYNFDIIGLYVFDDKNFNSKTDADGNRQWQAVFDPSHDLQGTPRFVISTQRLRVYLTGLDSPDIEAERYDAASGSWSSVSIPTTDWEILDVDLKRVGLHSTSVQVRFRDTTTPSDVRTVNLYFSFGAESLIVGVPPTESATIPPGITDRLVPIARAADAEQTILQPERTLVPKREVRK
jgi:hypothetical protein